MAAYTQGEQPRPDTVFEHIAALYESENKDLDQASKDAVKAYVAFASKAMAKNPAVGQVYEGMGFSLKLMQGQVVSLSCDDSSHITGFDRGGAYEDPNVVHFTGKRR